MDILTVTETILKWAIPFILSSVASAVIAYSKGAHKRATEREKAIQEGLQCLLRMEILRSNDKFTGQGYCPVDRKDALKTVYHAYHALGGNDVATKLYENCIGLPENPI